MPELPEVETVRRQLARRIVGMKIDKVIINYEKMIHPSVSDFIQAVEGATFLEPSRIGKYLFLHLDNQKTIISHLRMEGKYRYGAIEEVPSRHCHVRFVSGQNELSYLDTRKFGTMDIVNTVDIEKTPSIAKLGPEPFFETCTPAYLHNQLKRRKMALKSVLLDQHVMCGIGNIYADEILFAVKLHPEMPACHVSRQKAGQIITEARRILTQGIKAGGASIRTYQSLDTIDGMFQLELAVHMQKDKPCGCCQTPIEKIKVGGRGTYYCPKCQKRRK